MRRALRAKPRGADRARSRPRRRWSISASVVLQPRLTRIVDGGELGLRPPSPSSTWLGPTLPEEQAAPALTMTPSRSSAMTWVSAATPGMAIAAVFGQARRRGAKHDRLGRHAATPASSASRSARTRS